MTTGQECFVYDEQLRNISAITCDCGSTRLCVRGQAPSIDMTMYPLWFSYGVMMALSLFFLNVLSAIAQGQEM